MKLDCDNKEGHRKEAYDPRARKGQIGQERRTRQNMAY